MSNACSGVIVSSSGKSKRHSVGHAPVVFSVIKLIVPAFLLAQVREVVEARPVTGPLSLIPIVGLRLLLHGRLGSERAASFLMLAGVFVGLRLRVEVVGDVHDVRIW